MSLGELYSLALVGPCLGLFSFMVPTFLPYFILLFNCYSCVYLVWDTHPVHGIPVPYSLY